jgi:actin-related protein 5
MKKADFVARVIEFTPFDSESELEAWVKKTDADIKRKQKKDMGDEPDATEEEPKFPLVDVPDEELDEVSLKEKRRQRLMKAGWEARVKVREEKKKERERQDELRRQEEEERTTDLSGWSARLREEQEVRFASHCRPKLMEYRR